jgi:hypothetical protein
MGRRPEGKRPKPASVWQARWRAKVRRREAEAEEAEAYAESWRGIARLALPVAPEFRVGDAREVLRDIAPDSVALVLTDPPWGDDARPLIPWLADFAERVLVPGGSLLCFMGGAHLLTAAREFERSLSYCRHLVMLHDLHVYFRRQAVRVCHRDVLWFVKGDRRPLGGQVRTVQSAIRWIRSDKSAHPWQKGPAVWQWIEPLTEPADLIVDPFCGSGEWGRLAGQMGRRFIGSDLREGGSTRIVA